MKAAFRYCLLILLLILISIGACGCVDKQNTENKEEIMKAYACEKYDCEFIIEYFQAAKDETYTDILSLNDGEHIFNVYQSGDNEVSDDYAQVIASKKVLDYLKTKINYNYDIFGYFMFANGNTLTFEYVTENDISIILNNNTVLKAIVVVRMSDEISDCSAMLFDIYREIMRLKPKYIDFEVVQTACVDNELNDMLNNFPALYDNDWSKYSDIKTYLSITDTSIDSIEEFTNGGK